MRNVNLGVVHNLIDILDAQRMEYQVMRRKRGGTTLTPKVKYIRHKIVEQGNGNKKADDIK